MREGLPNYIIFLKFHQIHELIEPQLFISELHLAKNGFYGHVLRFVTCVENWLNVEEVVGLHDIQGLVDPKIIDE